MTTMVVENQTRPLVKTDLCDRCGAAAMVVARKLDKPTIELYFCNHHGAEYKDALLDQDFYIDIETMEDRNQGG